LAVLFVGAFFLAVDFEADLGAAVFFAVDFDAVDFLALDRDATAFFAVVFLAGDVLAVRRAGLVLAAVRLAADFFAVPLEDGAAFFAGVLADAALSLGSFLAPETTFLNSAPARNFGTALFFARTRWPVAGLRTIRDGRMVFSNAPNPVMATFSPLATWRVTMSTTEPSALDAALLSPS